MENKRKYFQRSDDNNYKPEHYDENRHIKQDLKTLCSVVLNELKSINSMDIPSMFAEEFGDTENNETYDDEKTDVNDVTDDDAYEFVDVMRSHEDILESSNRNSQRQRNLRRGHARVQSIDNVSDGGDIGRDSSSDSSD